MGMLGTSTVSNNSRPCGWVIGMPPGRMVLPWECPGNGVTSPFAQLVRPYISLWP